MKAIGVPIDHVRTSKWYSTYDTFPIPNIKGLVKLKGDFSWAKIPINVLETVWETFVANPKLWELTRSPTSCYVDNTFEHHNDKILFYRDQQDCVQWYIDPQTGKIYEDGQDTPIADDIEEFWLRITIENELWYKMSNMWSFTGVIPDYILERYAEFYLKE